MFDTTPDASLSPIFCSSPDADARGASLRPIFALFMMQVHPLCSSLLRMHPCDVNVEIQFILSLMAVVYALRSPMKIDVQTIPNSSLFVSPHSTTFPFHSDAS